MLWLASCKELGLNGLLQLLLLLLLLILLGRKSGWPGISFTLGAAAVTQEVLFKGNLLDPFHGTMARRSRILSIEDKAWSWLMDAGEWIRQMGSQFTKISSGKGWSLQDWHGARWKMASDNLNVRISFWRGVTVSTLVTWSVILHIFHKWSSYAFLAYDLKILILKVVRYLNPWNTASIVISTIFYSCFSFDPQWSKKKKKKDFLVYESNFSSFPF